MPKLTKEELGEMKAFALFGEYFQMWAMLEEAVLTCIQRALGLDYGQRIAVLSHIQWRDRIDILRTLISMMPLSADKKTEFDQRLVKIAKMSGVRNMAAHNLFFPSADGSLTFYQSKAKGKVETPIHKWTRKSVTDLNHQLFQEIKFLKKVNTEIGAVKSLWDITSALMANPTNALASLGNQFLQAPLTDHGELASPEATQKNDPPAETEQT